MISLLAAADMLASNPESCVGTSPPLEDVTVWARHLPPSRSPEPSAVPRVRLRLVPGQGIELGEGHGFHRLDDPLLDAKSAVFGASERRQLSPVSRYFTNIDCSHAQLPDTPVDHAQIIGDDAG